MTPEAFTSFLSSVPIDWFIIGGLAIFFAFDVLRSGAARVCALTVAFPIALLLMSLMPGAAFLGNVVGELTPLVSALVTLILFAVLYLLLRRMDLFYARDYGEPLNAALAGCAGTIVILVLWTNAPALEAVWDFGSDIDAIFSGQYAFWWLVGSYATLAFVRS